MPTLSASTIEQGPSAALRALAGLTHVTTSSLDPDEVLAAIPHAAATMTGAPLVLLWTANELTRSLTAVSASDERLWSDYPLKALRFDEGAVGEAARRRRPVIISDFSGDTRILPVQWLRSRGLTSCLVTPLVLQDRVLGVLEFYGRSPFTHDAEQLAFLEGLISQAALALDNTRLQSAQAVRAARLRALAELNQVVATSLDPRVVLRAVAATAQSLLGGEAVTFWILDEATRILTPLSLGDGGATGVDERVTVQTFDRGVLDWLATQRRLLNVEDVGTDERVSTQTWFEASGLRSLLGVPVVLEDSLIGVLTMCGRAPFTVGPDEEDILNGLAVQAATAFRNSRLFTASEQRRQTAEALAELGRTLTQSLDHDVVAQRIVDSLRTLLRTKMSVLYRIDPESENLVFVAGTGPTVDWNLVLPRGTATVGRAIVERRPVATADILADPSVVLTPQHNARIKRSGYRAVLAVPLLIQRRIIGALAVGDEAGRVFQADEIRLIQSFGDQAAIALENARLFSVSEGRRRAAEALAQVGQTLAQSLDLDVVSQRVLEAIGALLRAEFSVLYRLDRDTGRLVAIAVPPSMASVLGPSLVLAKGSGLAGRAVQERRPLTTTNLLEDPQITFEPEVRARIEKLPYRAGLAVPLVVQNEVIGALSVGDRLWRIFDEEDVRLAQAFADQAAMALQNAQVLHESKTRQERLEALLEVNRRLSLTQSLESLLHSIAEACGRLLDSESVGFRLLEGDELVVAGTWGDADQMMSTPRLKIGESLSGAVAASGAPLFVDNAADDPRLVPAHRQATRRIGYLGWLGVPVKIGERVVGVLSVRTRRTTGFNQADVAVATAFASQAAIALENARLFGEVRRRAQSLETLAQLTRLINGAMDTGDVFGFITKSAAALLEAKLIRLWLLTPDARELTIQSSWGIDPELEGQLTSRRRAPVGYGIVGRIAESREAMFLSDVRSDSGWINPELVNRLGAAAFAGVPLIVGEKVVGVLVVFLSTTRTLDGSEREVIKIFADQAAIAIEKAGLYERLADKSRRLEVLNRVSLSLTAARRQEEAFTTVTRAAIELFGDSASSLWVVDGSANDIVLASDEGLRHPEQRSHRTLMLGQGLIGRVVAAQRPIVLDDVQRETGYVNQALGQAEGFRATMAVPLLFGDRCFGALSVRRRTEQPFNPGDVDLLTALANHAAIALENARLFEEVRRRVQGLETLTRLTRLINSAPNAHAVYDAICVASNELLGAAHTRVWVDDPVRAGLRMGGSHGLDPVLERSIMGADFIRYGQAVAGPVFATRQPAIIPDIQQHPPWGHQRLARETGLRTCAAWPLVAGDRAVGVLIILFRGDERILTAEEQELIALFADQAAIAVEKSRLYEETNQAVKDLQGKNAELDSFAHIVSHDLKSPLVTIQGMASLLGADYSDQLDERGRHYLRRIESNVGQMERLIGDVLVLSKVGREARPAEMVQLDEVVAEVLQGLEAPIGARGVQVTCGDLGAVRAVRTQIGQVFSNLISNALKYLGDSPEPRIEIGAREHGEFVECYVRDNGIGIDAAYQQQIFEMFQRLKEIPAEGTGVGLPIVKKIVEAAGGQVRVESAKGCGSTFFFTWPTRTKE